MKTANWFLLEDEQYRIDFFRERGVPAANVFLWPEQLVSAVEQAGGLLSSFSTTISGSGSTSRIRAR